MRRRLTPAPRRPLLLAIALAAATGSSFVAAPQAAAAEKSIWGPVTLPSGPSAFPVYRELGVDTLQITLNVPLVAPTRPEAIANPSDPAYRWPAEIDAAISEGGRHGIEVALLAVNSPGWMNGGGSVIDAPQPADFAAFMTAASRRYPAVRRWMVWGEPNRDDRFRPNGEDSPAAPRAYAPILDAAYGALKEVDAGDIVVGGMTWSGGTVKPARFLELMRLPNGLPPRLDEFGHNPFPYRFPDLRANPAPGGWRDISDLDTFGEQLRQTYAVRCCATPRFWLSEFTIQSDHPSPTFPLFVSREEQARWLTAAYGIADELDSVAGLAWLSLLDSGDSPSSENWGLLTAREARKPAFDAYKAAPGGRYKLPKAAPAPGAARATPTLLRPRASARQVRRPARTGRARSRLRGVVRVRVRGRMNSGGRPCAGRLRIRTRIRGGRRLSRTARMGRSCRYSERYAFSTRRLPRRLRPRGRRLILRIDARFEGNSRLRPARSPSRRVLVRR